MHKSFPLAAIALLSLFSIAPHIQAQGAPTKAAEAIRQQKLKAAQAAALAAARAHKPAPTAVATVNRPVPIAVARTRPAATVAPKASTAATTPAPSGNVKPTTSAAPATSAVPTALPAHAETQAIALDLAALRQSRPDRRHAEVLDLEAHWGGLLRDAGATAELKQHAQRTAYLQRIRALGSKGNDANFVKS